MSGYQCPCSLSEHHVSPGGQIVVTITARQLIALRALQRTAPELGELAKSVALAFHASNIKNLQLARLILEKTCRRIFAGEPGSLDAVILQLETFGDLNCLSPAQVSELTDRIRKLAYSWPMVSLRVMLKGQSGSGHAGQSSQRQVNIRHPPGRSAQSLVITTVAL